ncbi:MAG: hypothetical protein IKW01_03590 [Firmicutes bacterium]|nr:hypothetical protein [Bacillota bacterium]
MAKIISKVAIVVLVLGIIFAWIGHFARVGATDRRLKEVRKERSEYVERAGERFEEHRDNVDSDHDPDKCETCDPWYEAKEEYENTVKTLEESNTSVLMDTLKSCLWYVIGCGILICIGEKKTED